MSTKQRRPQRVAFVGKISHNQGIGFFFPMMLALIEKNFVPLPTL
jgi:hypothetical protein